MSYKSTRAKRRLLNLTYRALNAEYKERVSIKRDPLCRRYEVNRFCASVHHKTKTPTEIVRFLFKVLNKRYADSELVKDTFGYTIDVNGLKYHMYISKNVQGNEVVNVGIC